MKRIVTIDDHIKCRKLDELLDAPVVIRVNKFDEDSAKDFSEEMAKAHDTGQPVIPIVIDSYGGYVDSLISMISDIKHSDIPVATICQGKAMSCGAILLTCGTEDMRYIDVGSRVMIHEISSASWGKSEEIQASAREVDRLNKYVFKVMDKNCGHPANYFLDQMRERNNADWFLTAQQAKTHNLVQHIGVPSLKVHVAVNYEFE